MRFPILILAFIWGISLFVGANIPLSKLLSILLFFIGTVFVIISIFRYSRKSKRWFIYLIIAVFLFGLMRMGWYHHEHQTDFPVEIAKQDIGIRGYINSYPVVDGDLVKLIVEPISYQWKNKEVLIDTKEKVLVYLFLQEEADKKIVHKWTYGMGIRLNGVIDKPFSAGNPGQFNYQAYLAQQSIYWNIKVNDVSQVQTNNGKPLFHHLFLLKEKMLNQIDVLFEQPQAGFIKAILLGEREDLDEEIREAFSILGLSHLLAISGLHLSTLAFLLYWLLTKMRWTREKTIYFITFFLIGYMLLTGASASVVRATMMTMLMLYGLVGRRAVSALQALGIAFIGMTAYDPMWMYGVGFQLSFIVTFAILWFFPMLYERLPLHDSRLKQLITLLIVTQAASFPLVFYYFHQYSLLSWVMNLLIVPLFSAVIFPLALIIYLLSFIFLPFSLLFAKIINILLEWLFLFTHWTASFSLFHFYGSVSSFLWAVMIYIIFAWLLLRNKIRESFMAFTLKKNIFWLEKLVFLFFISMMIWNTFVEQEGLITVIDVGQGDSILIETPNHKHILIDSGGKFDFEKEEWRKRKDPFDVGKDIVLPYLHYRGIHRLDLAIVTHEDFDHLGGYLSLVDHVKIETFVVGQSFPLTEYGKNLQRKLKEKNIKIVHVNKLQAVQPDKYTKMILFPVDLKHSEQNNDHSLVVFLHMYQTTSMFSGDLEAEGEKELLGKYLLPEVDLLKVGHHGSNSSTSVDWLKTLQPKHAIISVGANNRYHHPSQEVLKRLIDTGATIWRTDKDGAILIHMNKDGYEIEKSK